MLKKTLKRNLANNNRLPVLLHLSNFSVDLNHQQDNTISQ